MRVAGWLGGGRGKGQGEMGRGGPFESTVMSQKVVVFGLRDFFLKNEQIGSQSVTVDARRRLESAGSVQKSSKKPSEHGAQIDAKIIKMKLRAHRGAIRAPVGPRNAKSGTSIPNCSCIFRNYGSFGRHFGSQRVPEGPKSALLIENPHKMQKRGPGGGSRKNMKTERKKHAKMDGF